MVNILTYYMHKMELNERSYDMMNMTPERKYFRDLENIPLSDLDLGFEGTLPEDDRSFAREDGDDSR